MYETNSCLVEARGLYEKYGLTSYEREHLHLACRCDLAMKLEL